MKVSKGLDRFDETKSSLKTWILNIAKNALIDYYRKKKLNVVSFDEVIVSWAYGEEESDVDQMIAIKESNLNPEEKMIEAEVSKRMYDKFETLSENEKLIASLHFFDGLSYDEVAESLNIPLGTVKVKLFTARKTMMEALPLEYRKTVNA